MITLLAMAVFGTCAAGQGYIQKDGKRMEVRDSFAVLDKQLGKLTIYLLPSRLSVAEKQKIKNGSAIMVLLPKDSPDAGKWNWYPYAKLELKDARAKFTSANDLYSYYLMAYGINKQNYTDNLNGHFQGNETLRHYRLGSSRVEFDFSGRQKSMDLRWQLDVNAPLL
jgi:hypothetical protein